METRIIKITPKGCGKEPDRNAIEKCKEYLKTIFPNAESIADSQSAYTPTETKREHLCPWCSKEIPIIVLWKWLDFWFKEGDYRTRYSAPCCNKGIAIAEVLSMCTPEYRLEPLEITCASSKHPLSTFTEKEGAKIEEIL